MPKSPSQSNGKGTHSLTLKFYLSRRISISYEALAEEAPRRNARPLSIYTCFLALHKGYLHNESSSLKFKRSERQITQIRKRDELKKCHVKKSLYDPKP